MHEVNMEVRDYKEAYRDYIERMTEVDELREVVLLKQELEITRRNMREIEAQLKEREEEALVLEKFGA
jgi:phage-related tail protein